MMGDFQTQAKELLINELKRENISLDIKLIDTIAKYFAYTKEHWEDGVFELRAKQLLFAYHIAYYTLNNPHMPLSLGLGCGEGKQEGFAVAMRSVWELYIQREAKEPKLLFLSATTDLVTQMKESVPFRDFAHLHLLDEDLKTNEAKSSGIYLCDFTTYLYFGVRTKYGYDYSLFKNIDKIFVDEIHALLHSSPYIISTKLITPRELSKTQTKELKEVFVAYQKLQETIKELSKRNPKLIAQSDKRDKAAFNPYKLKKDGVLMEEYLYNTLKSSEKQLLKKLNLKNKNSFYALLDVVADAFAKTLGKDYYLHTDNSDESLVVGYSCANSSTAKPMPNTLYQEKLLATLIALKHTKDILKNEKEFLFVADTYLPTKEVELTPLESLQLFGVQNFITASATLNGISTQLGTLGFCKIVLQDELQLTLDDSKVDIHISKKNPIDTFKESIKNLSEQVLVTSIDSSLLEQIATDAQVCEIFKEYEFCKVFYHLHNPDTKSFEIQLQKLKDAIYNDPFKKRVLFVQGIAEGSNIFKTTPKGSYEASVFKLDIHNIDTITQTRYRVGVRGRVQGEFYHSVSTHIQTASILTIEEVKELHNTQESAKVLLAIEKKLQKQKDISNIAHYRYESANNTPSRRDFLNRAFKLGIASVALNPLLPYMEKIFSLPLYPQDAQAEDFWDKFAKTVPPGIANCRDKEILRSYYYAKDPNAYYLGDQQFTYQRLLNETYGDLKRIDPDTPYIEPAFWFMSDKLNIFPKEEIYEIELKKKNLALYYFAKGITRYFTNYIRNYGGYKNKEIESAFLNSIFIAAGKYDPNMKYKYNTIIPEVEEYMNSTIQEKKQKLLEILKIYRSYDINPKARKINDNYNKLLVAAWSSYWLIEQYYINEKKGPNTMLINLNLEHKLIRLSKKKINNIKYTDLRIRGPPYYNLFGN